MPTFPRSNYWIQAANTARPYAPPICHMEYGPILSRPAPSGFSSMFSISLFNRNTSATATCDARAVWMENHDHPRLLASTSYVPADADGPIVREPFSLPLVQNDDGSMRQEVWTANTRMVFDVGGLNALEWLRLELLRPGGATAVMLADLNPGEIMRRILADDEDMTQENRNGRPCMILPLASARLVGVNGLTPAASPYKLRLRVRDQSGVETEAWTYFHVPHAEDVTVLHRYAAQKIILLADSMQGVSAVAGCTLQADADVSDLYLTAEETSGFTRRGTNASKVARYGQLGGARNELEGMRRTLKGYREQEASTPRGGEPWQLLQDNISRTQLQIQGQERLVQRLESEVPERMPPPHVQPSARLYSKHEVNVLMQRPSGRYFFGLSWGIIFVARRGGHGWYAHRLYAPGNYRLVRAHDEHWNVEVDSDRNFQTARWSGGGQDTWHVYDFALDAFPLERAITFGVSACSAGVIFPDVAAPDYVIVSHINNFQSCPMPRVITDLMGEHVIPADANLRSLVTVFPQHQEMAKYLPDQLFPLAVRPNARVILLPRSRHVYGIDESPNYGHDSFGLEFSADDVHFVGEYGLEQWSNAMAVLWQLLRAQNHPCGCRREAHSAARVKCDFDAGVFGPSERLKTTKAELPAFRTFFEGVRQQGAPIREDLNDAVARARRRFKFARLGSGLFAAVDGAASEFRNTDVNLVDRKAVQFLHGTPVA